MHFWRLPAFPERQVKGGGSGVRKKVRKVLITALMVIAFLVIYVLSFPIYAS